MESRANLLVVDFGSQTAHLIARRIRDFGIKVKIIHPEDIIQEISKNKPKGIILSGGPASVYEKDAHSINKSVFSKNIPLLGICYGWQLTAKLLGGKVVSGHKEYGPANFKIDQSEPLFSKIDSYSQVWVSHGDTVVRLPTGFKMFGETESVHYAAAANLDKKIFGVQFQIGRAHV